MRKRLVCIACALAVGFGGTVSSPALTDGSPEAVAVDAVFVRPFCLLGTIGGSALFVVALPIALITKSTGKTADALVKAPAKATFERPLGKLSM
jgi:hypothetical protein